jgi:hypothetical protein
MSASSDPAVPLLAWRRLRFLSPVPLFSLALSVFVLLVLFVNALAFYNHKVQLARDWAEQTLRLERLRCDQEVDGVVEQLGQSIPGLSAAWGPTTRIMGFMLGINIDEYVQQVGGVAREVIVRVRSTTVQVAEGIRDRLPLVQPTWELRTAFLASVLLALAGLLYRFGCPAVVREYSGLKWHLELKQPLTTYEQADRSRIPVFLLCVLTLATGSVLTIALLAVRVQVALAFLWASR